MAVRERIGEIAVLKTLGFSNGALAAMVIAEAVVITLVGGALGLLLARGLLMGESSLQSFFPGLAVTSGTIALGLFLAFILGVVTGAIPAWQSARLSVAGALRRIG
jgi:putative ABC transport system permease protein